MRCPTYSGTQRSSCMLELRHSTAFVLISHTRLRSAERFFTRTTKLSTTKKKKKKTNNNNAVIWPFLPFFISLKCVSAVAVNRAPLCVFPTLFLSAAQSRAATLTHARRQHRQHRLSTSGQRPAACALLSRLLGCCFVGWISLILQLLFGRAALGRCY